MPAPDNIDVLIARYLRDRGFNKVLSLFYDAVGELEIPSTGPSLGEILEERRNYLDSIPATKNSTELETSGDTDQAGSVVTEGALVLTPKVLEYSDASLIVGLALADLKMSPKAASETKIVATMADKSLRIMSKTTTPESSDRVLRGLHGTGAIKCVKPIGQRYLLTAGMDGGLRLTDLWKKDTGEDRGNDNNYIKAHNKFIIGLDIWQSENNNKVYVASASYDNHVKIHEFNLSTTTTSQGFRFLGSMELSTTPTCLRFANDGKLLLTKKDSTFVYVVKFQLTQEQPGPLTQLARFDLCEAQFASHSFTILDFVLINNGYLVAATSHTPYQRLIIAKLSPDSTSASVVQNVCSYAPQDKFSSAQIAHCPHNEGHIVFVTGDDGITRGLSVPEGKLIAKLDKIHTTRVKAVDAYIGQNNGNTSRPVVVTGGFDKIICIWS